MTLTSEQKLRFYRNQGSVSKIIKKNIKRRGHTVYGGRAHNAHLPAHLDMYTEDWDVFTKTPKKTARRVERKLDKRFGGNFFEVRPAIYPGTTKVISRVTGSGVADYTKPEKKRATKTIGGIKYVTRKEAKCMLRASLRNPDAKFRHKKDREALQRLSLHEKAKRVRRRREPLSVLNINPSLLR